MADKAKDRYRWEPCRCGPKGLCANQFYTWMPGGGLFSFKKKAR